MSDRAELLIEPFFYTFEHPRNESKVQGLGDLEITPSYEFVLEHGWVPAILAAFKLKVPTGSKDAGGSGKFDYLPYFILGQHYRDWTFNCNVGINVVTPQDRGQKYKKADTWALEAERDITPNLGVLAEVFSTEDRVKTASGALEYKWNKVLNTFGVVGYTQDHESIFRIGFNLRY